MERTGTLRWADEAEWLFYNAGFGMRHPEESSNTYCRTDNCYTLDERKHPDDVQWNPRYRFSPTHQDVAVCCVPNSGRMIPYFVQSMFVESEQGYKAALYGSCTFTGIFHGVRVQIAETTDYPFDFDVNLDVTVERPVEMNLCLRFPQWADDMTVNGKIYRREEVSGGEIVISRRWQGTISIKLSMNTQIRFKTDFNRDCYVSYGPVLYAVPLEAEEKTVRKLKPDPFMEKAYTPVDRKWEKLQIAYADFPTFRLAGEKPAKSFEDLKIMGSFRLDGCTVENEMVPLAKTILRKVTFEGIR